MTASRDPDRLIHNFLMEGEEQLHDQVYDAVRAEIEQKRQRAGLGSWRELTMNRIVTYGLGAAAVAVAGVFLGAQLLGSPGNTGSGGPPDATPTPQATATSAPTTTSEPTPAGLPVGSTFDISHFTSPISAELTIPAEGWSGEPGGGILARDNVDPPNGAGIITFVVSAEQKDAGDGLFVYGDPCQWSTTKPETPATTVDEFVAAMSVQKTREASAPVDITLDGHAGKSMTLHVPENANRVACDSGYFTSWGTAYDETARYNQGPGQIDRLWIVDVDGNLVVIDAGYYAGTPQDIVDGIDAIINSIKFGALP